MTPNFKKTLRFSVAKARCVAFMLLVLPTSLARPFTHLLGARIHRSARVGFSWVYAPTLRLGLDTRIGHFNAIRVRRLVVRRRGAIGSLNWLAGSFSVILHEDAEIGARNVITRAVVAKEIGYAHLRIGRSSKITAGHKLDLLRTISFGDNSILAGLGSQLWTHGYVHESVGSGRFRVDGAISVGNNVYIGSACVFNPGVCTADDVAIGSQCCISKDLLLPGFYVNQPLRHIERSAKDLRRSLVPVELFGLTEPVFTKKRCRSEADS